MKNFILNLVQLTHDFLIPELILNSLCHFVLFFEDYVGGVNVDERKDMGRTAWRGGREKHRICNK